MSDAMKYRCGICGGDHRTDGMKDRAEIDALATENRALRKRNERAIEMLEAIKPSSTSVSRILIGVLSGSLPTDEEGE